MTKVGRKTPPRKSSANAKNGMRQNGMRQKRDAPRKNCALSVFRGDFVLNVFFGGRIRHIHDSAEDDYDCDRRLDVLRLDSVSA